MKRFALAALIVVCSVVASVGRGEAAGSATWTVQTTPTPNVTQGGGDLVGVSCPSVTDCVGVGYDLGLPLSETWNGTKWTVRPVSPPPGYGYGDLQAVSCPSTSMVGCTAVGEYIETSGNEATLVERWSNGHWVLQPTPPTFGGAAGSATLLAVDCLTVSDCVAVGTQGPAEAGSSAPLVEQWNGSSWAVMPSASPPGFTWNVLNGVSCSSRSACVAVGSSQESSPGGTQFMIAEGLSGGQWGLLTTPEPAGATQSSLGSVSCMTDAKCVAVGAATIAGTVESLAEEWDASQWTIEPMPNVNAPELNGVSCPAPGDCTAVGSYNTSSNNTAGAPLAETWNGSTWSVETPPLPKGRTVAWLWSDSCVSTTACEAVGFSLDKNSDNHTLAEGATG